MDVVALLIANTKTTLFEQPGEHALDDAAIPTQATPVFRVAFGNQRLDATRAKGLANLRFGIVSLVTEHFLGPATASTARLLDGRDGINQRNGLLRIVDVRGSVDQGQRCAFAIGGHVPFRPVFPAIGGIRASLRPPKTARTEQLSKIALDQSISPANPSSSNSSRHTFSQTPAACQSRRRRQHVMPLPQPISCGRYSQPQPVLNTNKMPVSARRFSIGGRPPLGLGFVGGSSGSIRSHNSSVSSGLAISCSSMNFRNLARLPTHLQYRFC